MPNSVTPTRLLAHNRAECRAFEIRQQLALQGVSAWAYPGKSKAEIPLLDPKLLFASFLTRSETQEGTGPVQDRVNWEHHPLQPPHKVEVAVALKLVEINDAPTLHTR